MIELPFGIDGQFGGDFVRGDDVQVHGDRARDRAAGAAGLVQVEPVFGGLVQVAGVVQRHRARRVRGRSRGAGDADCEGKCPAAAARTPPTARLRRARLLMTTILSSTAFGVDPRLEPSTLLARWAFSSRRCLLRPSYGQTLGGRRVAERRMDEKLLLSARRSIGSCASGGASGSAKGSRNRGGGGEESAWQERSADGRERRRSASIVWGMPDQPR